MAKSKANAPKNKQLPVRTRNRQNLSSTQRSGPSVLTPPRLNLASNVGRQSEIALPVRRGLSTLTIHPDNTRWLGEAAPSFQRWGMADLTLWYEPRVATSVNGQIALACLSDFADRLPDSLEDTVTLAGAQRGAPWSRFQLPKLKNRLYDYCSLSDFGLDGVTSMADRSPGRIVVWADMDAGFAASDIVGWVYISYKPVLHDPILRKMQLSTTGGGEGGSIPNPVPSLPSLPGRTGWSIADYYYKEKAYTTAWDFLGLNPTYNNEIVTLTPRTGYKYSTDLKTNAVINTSSQTVRLAFECIFRDFSKFSTPGGLKFNTAGTDLFPGNKGNYTAWANGDVLVRLVGDIRPGGWFFYDNSILTSWSQTEVYMYELGLENGVAVPPLEQPVFDWLVAPKVVTFQPEVAVSTVPEYTGPKGYSFVLGPTTRNANYVGFSNYGSTTKDLGFGITMATNGAVAAPTNPANRLGISFRNTSGGVMVLQIMLLLVNYGSKYGTEPVVATIDGSGTILDSITSSTMAATQVTNVRLQPGAAVYWSLTKRSSVLNGVELMESMGDVVGTIMRPDAIWMPL